MGARSKRRRRALRNLWNEFRRDRRGMIGLMLILMFVVIAVLGPLLIPAGDVSAIAAPGKPHRPPTLRFPLGTDNFGRSVFALLVYGTRVSLFVGFVAAFVATAIGGFVGIVAGFYGRWLGWLLNGITDWFLVIPWIALAVVMAVIIGPSLWNITLVIAITSWATTARLVRSQTLSLKERPYVERARALGSGNARLITNHILPNVLPLIFANTILTVALAILSETTLSLLGLGDPLTVSWGQIIQESFGAGSLTAGYWWWLIPPGVMIMLVVSSFTLCGMALDGILNPRTRRR